MRSSSVFLVVMQHMPGTGMEHSYEKIREYDIEMIDLPGSGGAHL